MALRMRRPLGVDKRFSIVPERFWRELAPLLPSSRRSPEEGGCPRVSDRAVLGGIL